MIRIVNFCGGRGAKFTIERILKRNGVFLTNIVNAYDDGKSTGEIRAIFKMLGPSDIRKTQIAMMPVETEHNQCLKNLFEYRMPFHTTNADAIKFLKKFSSNRVADIFGVPTPPGKARFFLRKLIQVFLRSNEIYERVHEQKLNFADCSLANCIYAGAYELCDRDFDKAVDLIGRFLNVQGEVLSTNTENKYLVAIRENGDILLSESEIVELRSNVRIKDVFILDNPLNKTASKILQSFELDERYEYLQKIQSYVMATSKVIERIANADIILYSSGTQHSSLYPSYMTRGISRTIRGNEKALKIFITNIGEDYEIPAYTSSELVIGAVRYLNKFESHKYDINDYIDIAFVNSKYRLKKQKYVKADKKILNKLGIDIVLDSFEDIKNAGKHDSVKLVNRLFEEYNKRWMEYV